MRLPAGAAGICSAAAAAATVAFAVGNQPTAHGCLGSGAVGNATQSTTVLILVEDLESDAPNTLLYDATLKLAQKLSPNDVVGVDFGTASGQLTMPLHPVGDRTSLANAIKEAQKVGIGDPGSYDDALTYAAQALSGVSGVKEVIILGDGDANPPSAATMNHLLSEGATVSAVFENPGGDDPSVMRKIASDGHGSFQNAGDAAHAPTALLNAVC